MKRFGMTCVLVLCAVVSLGSKGCVGRTATGPGGYLDHPYNQQLNMRATGVDDRQIPLDVRQKFASEHGLPSPTK